MSIYFVKYKNFIISYFTSYNYKNQVSLLLIILLKKMLNKNQKIFKYVNFFINHIYKAENFL